MRCRSRDIENSRRNDKEVARLLRGWKVLAASTIVAITIILCYGIVQSESISSLLNAVASGGTATTTTVTDDDYNNEVEGRFLSEDNQDNEEHQDNEEQQAEELAMLRKLPSSWALRLVAADLYLEANAFCRTI